MISWYMFHMQHTLEAMNHTSLQVEQLLSSEDKKLYQALKKVLHNSASCVRFAVSQEEQLPFHKRLRSILQPHVQKMLVGMLVMYGVCALALATHCFEHDQTFSTC